MTKINIEYVGDLHCKAVHELSGQEFMTDAPTDNMGKGEFFSPTDLVATAVGACISTVMGIISEQYGYDIEGLKINIQKEMTEKAPRRIGRITLDIVFPHKLTDEEFKTLWRAVEHCPVRRSIHPDIEIIANYSYAE